MKKREALVQARLMKKWTQEMAAKELNLKSAKTLSHWETGRTKNPPMKGMLQAEKKYGIPKEVLFPDVFGAELSNQKGGL